MKTKTIAIHTAADRREIERRAMQQTITRAMNNLVSRMLATRRHNVRNDSGPRFDALHTI